MNSENVVKLLFDYSKKNKASLILVTHNHEIANKCDRIIELKGGRIVLLFYLHK